MKIAYDDQQQPGVFIPLEEWPRLRTHFSEVNDFFEAHTSRSVLDMSQNELDTRLYLNSAKLNAKDLRNGSYNDRLNDNDRINAKFVNQHSNGEDEFVNIDQLTGRPETVRRIKR